MSRVGECLKAMGKSISEAEGVTVIMESGRAEKYSTKELKDMIDNWDTYYQADNLPKWIVVSLMNGAMFPPVIVNKRGKDSFAKAYKVIQYLIDNSGKTLDLNRGTMGDDKELTKVFKSAPPTGKPLKDSVQAQYRKWAGDVVNRMGKATVSKSASHVLKDDNYDSQPSVRFLDIIEPMYKKVFGVDFGDIDYPMQVLVAYTDF